MSHFGHLQRGYVGRLKPVPFLRNVSAERTSITLTTSYKMSSLMGFLIQTFAGKFLEPRMFLKPQ